MIIYKGDQYAVPFKIKIGGTVVTPEIADDVRIQIDKDLRSYLEQTLTFNPEKNSWDFYLTEELTRKLADGFVPFQAGVKIGTDIRHSQEGRLRIDNNIIRMEWDDG